MRKICRGISLYDLKQSHSFINSWKKFYHQRPHQVNCDYIFIRSLPDLYSRFLSSKIPIQGVGPKFLEENASHALQRSIFHFQRNS
jgi:hypothetical protein